MAIAALVDELWGDRHRTLVATSDDRTDAIAVDAGSDVADVWLTWRVRSHTDGTWVEVALDELDRGPEPDLATLLQALSRRIPTPPAADT
jgi:hypothetical protein